MQYDLIKLVILYVHTVEKPSYISVCFTQDSKSSITNLTYIVDNIAK